MGKRHVFCYQSAAIFTLTLELVISGTHRVVFENSTAFFVNVVTQRGRLDLVLVRL